MMTVGIVGLGLIGGSVAKAYKRRENVTVLGFDLDSSILNFAKLAEAVDGSLDDEKLSSCDIIFLAAYPQGVIDWVKTKAEFLKGTTVIDCTGTKKRICDILFPVAQQNGFTFIGGHPMAGMQNSGFKYSREDLFDGQPMVIVPPSFADIRLLDRVKTLLEPLGFGQVSVTTAAEHDEIIAFSSQMTHVISNAFIKSPTAFKHKGFSAGSYKDMTRVAWLMPEMWTELFLENKDYLLKEIDVFMDSMQQYRDAIFAEDSAKLNTLLNDGRLRKREVDGP